MPFEMSHIEKKSDIFCQPIHPAPNRKIFSRPTFTNSVALQVSTTAEALLTTTL
jgi:hypothetical protein